MFLNVEQMTLNPGVELYDKLNGICQISHTFIISRGKKSIILQYN